MNKEKSRCRNYLGRQHTSKSRPRHSGLFFAYTSVPSPCDLVISRCYWSVWAAWVSAVHPLYKVLTLQISLLPSITPSPTPTPTNYLEAKDPARFISMCLTHVCGRYQHFFQRACDHFSIRPYEEGKRRNTDVIDKFRIERGR